MAGRRELGGVARGLAAGVAATAVLTVLQEAVSRAQGGSQLREQAKVPRTWAEAPPPARVAKVVSEEVLSQRVTKKQAPLLAAAGHWAYGTALGGVFGLVQATVRPPALVHGLAFGTAVWGWAYVMLPALEIDEPIWRQQPQELASNLSLHLAYGLSLAGAYEALD
jgi:uncharacterized membrane protein YagU involved in acid resistance